MALGALVLIKLGGGYIIILTRLARRRRNIRFINVRIERSARHLPLHHHGRIGNGRGSRSRDKIVVKAAGEDRDSDQHTDYEPFHMQYSPLYGIEDQSIDQAHLFSAAKTF